MEKLCSASEAFRLAGGGGGKDKFGLGSGLMVFAFSVCYDLCELYKKNPLLSRLSSVAQPCYISAFLSSSPL